MNQDASRPTAHPQYVGFGPRFVASIIDSLVVTPLVVAMIYFLYQAGGSWMQMLWASRDNLWLHYGLPAGFVLTFWLIKSATPGKMATQAVIVDAKSLQKPQPWQLVVSYIGYFPSTLLFGLGFLWILWDPRKQSWHDKLARTVVIRPGSQPVQRQ